MFENDQLRGKTAVVKIGTTALCRPDGALDEELIAARIGEIAAAKLAGAFVVLVTSGAVAMGKKLCGGIGKPTDGKLTKFYASVGQPMLMNLYTRILSHHNLGAGQLLLNQKDIHSPHNLRDTLEDFRNHPQILPIINENDAVATPEFAEKLAFGDNDELAGEIAKLIEADRLIILSNVEGIYGADGNTIATICPTNDVNFIDAILRGAGQKSDAGRGGIKTKLMAALAASQNGISVHIASSRAEVVISSILKGKSVGTAIIHDQPQQRR
jgi:glutamate 5-kinase